MKSKRNKRYSKKRSGSLYKRTEIDVDKKRSFRFTHLLLVIFLIIFCYVFLFSGIFDIKKIDIKGTKAVEKGDVIKTVEESRDGYFFNDNILLLPSSGLAEIIEEKHNFKSVEIDKEYPSLVILRVTEFTPKINWISGENVYMLDKEGRVISKRENINNKLPKIYDPLKLKLEVGKSVADEKFLNFVLYLFNDFESVTNDKIKKIELNESLNEIKVILDSGYYILFDPTRNPKKELSNYLYAIKTITEDKTKDNLSYIDMRVENKVFYK